MRLSRKNRSCADIGYKHSGGIMDLFDNSIKGVFRINDAEYDYIAEKATDEELGFLVKESLTFAEKRECIKVLTKYLTEFENLNKTE